MGTRDVTSVSGRGRYAQAGKASSHGAGSQELSPTTAEREGCLFWTGQYFKGKTVHRIRLIGAQQDRRGDKDRSGRNPRRLALATCHRHPWRVACLRHPVPGYCGRRVAWRLAGRPGQGPCVSGFPSGSGMDLDQKRFTSLTISESRFNENVKDALMASCQGHFKQNVSFFGSTRGPDV